MEGNRYSEIEEKKLAFGKDTIKKKKSGVFRRFSLLISTLTHLQTSSAFLLHHADGAGQDEYDMDDEEVDNKKDYDVEYDPLAAAIAAASGDGDIAFVQSKSFVSTQGWDSEMVVDYRINEDEFHKISLLDCDFFIRKQPDPDNDVYEQMYVTPPDTDIYSIPRVLAPMPQKVQPFNPYWLLCVWNTYVLCSGALMMF
ncbi:hypothetical protein F2Q70_00040317 [Brassica cretica]|uniref:Uncharacterized protein n=1 Tax=Brassica cretica TaxID=69181 RepID=A0A8S9KC69_BRACR|nr:hypothetical protein F2Q70_00040317 [Brassica cretica]